MGLDFTKENVKHVKYPHLTHVKYMSGGRLSVKLNQTCYSCLNVDGGIEKLTIYHKKHSRFKHPEVFANYVINSPLFSGVFLTKSAKRGLEKGFKINTNHCNKHLRVGLISLRSPFEVKSAARMFDQLYEWGLDVPICFYFMNVFYANDGGLSFRSSVHGICIGKWFDPKRLYEKHKTPKNSTKLVDTGYLGDSLPSRVIGNSLTTPPNKLQSAYDSSPKERVYTGFGSSYSVSFNKENMLKLQEIVKETLL